MKHKLLNNSGFSIIATVMVMMILALFAAVAVSLVTTGSNIGLQEEQGDAAFYIAEGGLEKAVYKFKTGTACNSLGETDTSLGQGTFTIAGPAATLYTLSNTLSAGIAAGATTIPVTSSIGFAPKGRIMIDSEIIDYYEISGNNLINAVRGVAGTTPAAHSIGVSVAQDQCRIESTFAIAANIPERSSASGSIIFSATGSFGTAACNANAAFIASISLFKVSSICFLFFIFSDEGEYSIMYGTITAIAVSVTKQQSYFS